MADHHQHHNKPKTGQLQGARGILDQPSVLCCPPPQKHPSCRGERHTKTGRKREKSPDLDCGGLRKSAIWAPNRGLRGGYPEPRDGALGASL